ncbi:hypothetical protein SAMN05216262_1308 [Colwellia chukchiensis]|uniref:Orphan protein n=1 Tax=Colwellia chukchiensis TaxID=641665 RepID=A0A1H7TZ87_9GAMM|nr:hypothetical protein [Colwellia chukchiensis]SEL89277.1 hypothetical protein SAMN05216262_1308 [Colwellia chukchiensis]
MVTQSLLWQSAQQSSDFAELCNGLYERELLSLSKSDTATVAELQGRIKSLPHYIKRTAYALLNAQTPLQLDIQNASWSAKQANVSPSLSQLSAYPETVFAWYNSFLLKPGLVVPIQLTSHIVLDSIDRVDNEQQRIRTNVHGWFDFKASTIQEDSIRLLKPNKKVMTAACAGHRWQNQRKLSPVMPSLRELLLSCTINWRNFKQPVTNIGNN